jgi:hypothetical protein
LIGNGKLDHSFMMFDPHLQKAIWLWGLGRRPREAALRGRRQEAAHTILSMPRGPRLVRTESATALAASILEVLTSFFFALALCPSHAREKGYG